MQNTIKILNIFLCSILITEIMLTESETADK